MGKYIRHVACEECGSSDANGVYEDGSTWCFSCHTYKGKEGESNMPTSVAQAIKDQFEFESSKGTVSAITDRRITAETCKKYNVTVTTNDDGDITHHQNPYYDKHNSVVDY